MDTRTKTHPRAAVFLLCSQWLVTPFSVGRPGACCEAIGKGTFLFWFLGDHASVAQDQNNGGFLCCSMQSWWLHYMSAQETSIPTSPVRAVILCRTRIRKGSARFLRRRSSIRNRLPLQLWKPEDHRKNLKPGFRRRHHRNVRCTRNGSNCPPNRAASEPVTFPPENSNGGRT